MANTQVKKTTAFLPVVAMVLSMLLYFPGGTFSTYSGLKASAEGVTFTATVGTAGVAADGSEGYASLIDGKYSSTDTSDYSKWCVTNFSSAYIIFSASEPILVTGYSIVTGNDNKTFTGRNPKSWTLYGCNDASANSEEGKDTTSWKVIDAVTDDEQLEDENYTKYVYDKLTGSTSTKYQYFKLEITATQGSDVMQMSEFILTHCVHEWEISDTIDPTCIKGGYDVNECSICHWQKKVPTAEAWGHDFGEDGLCTRCGVEDTTPKEPSVVNNVYQIGTAGELYWFAYKVNNDNSNFGSARAVLTADITVNSNLLGSMTFDAYGNVSNGTRFTSWTPIGNSVFNAYSGTFDGQNYTIRGLYFNDSTVNDVSLFGYNNGTVKNVSVVDSYFKGYKNVGGVCGFNGGTITSCYNTGTVSGTEPFVGGVCGYNDSSSIITNCHYDSTVYSGNAVGKDYATGTNAVGKITDDFKRGEVAYLLQSGQTAVNGIIPEVWGQTIGTDKSPVLGGEKVYATTGCVTYNNSSDTSKKEHKYDDNGFCACNGYESANLTTDKYNIDGVDGFDEVYEISNAGQLYWFAQLVNSRNTSVNAVLTDNITVNSNLLSSLEYDKEDNVTNGASFRSWTPIGTSHSIAYTGKFDGQNHTISGLYYYNTYSTIGIYIGLFGYVGDVGENVSVSNVGVVDSYFKAYNYVGGVCGRN
uniref:GLUG motif-containing protein n=1 Tax=Ruminococcus flavefaciens TaxID=1265 RepID=UPI0034E97B76